MNARIPLKALGACAAVAVALPIVLGPTAARAWYRSSQSYVYPPAQSYVEEEDTYGPAYSESYGPAYSESTGPSYVERSERSYPESYRSTWSETYSTTSPERYRSTYVAPYAYRRVPDRTVVREEYYGSSEPPRAYSTYRSYRSGAYVPMVELNMREGPNDLAPVVAVVPPGTPLHVAGPDVGGWVRVTSPFGAGWVYSRYLAAG